jgi:hypothetical protein
MSVGKESDEEWLTPEEIVARDVEASRREQEELHAMILERCSEEERRWRASHPWLAPGMCVTVPVPLLSLPLWG